MPQNCENHPAIAYHNLNHISQNISQLPDSHITNVATNNSMFLNVTQNNDITKGFLLGQFPIFFN
ncbi:hypothetical protein [Nostoc sp. FACHB-280]|uniref:hypothetical protein n=1 Tax=Nostoc sp. FACHB-280 TaxID=2692839 RepID=UPI0019A9CE61|nr:hypothetical protein [Nostoc sp. FACHB-280]MBD2497021.1 hypothetical protein [Nostoc sp. FACHB-280]